MDELTLDATIAAQLQPRSLRLAQAVAAHLQHRANRIEGFKARVIHERLFRDSVDDDNDGNMRAVVVFDLLPRGDVLVPIESEHRLTQEDLARLAKLAGAGDSKRGPGRVILGIVGPDMAVFTFALERLEPPA